MKTENIQICILSNIIQILESIVWFASTFLFKDYIEQRLFIIILSNFLFLIKCVHQQITMRIRYYLMSSYIVNSIILIEMSLLIKNPYNVQLNSITLILNMVTIKEYFTNNQIKFYHYLSSIYYFLRMTLHLFQINQFENFPLLLIFIIFIYTDKVKLELDLKSIIVQNQNDSNLQLQNNFQEKNRENEYENQAVNLEVQYINEKTIIHHKMKKYLFKKYHTEISLNKHPEKKDDEEFLEKKSQNNSVNEKFGFIFNQDKTKKQGFQTIISSISLHENQSDQMNNFLKNFLNQFPSGICIINSKKKIIFLNSKCENILHCTGQDSILFAINEGIFMTELEIDSDRPAKSSKNSKYLSHQKQIERQIRLAQENDNQIDFIEFIFNLNKNYRQFSNSFNQSYRSSQEQLQADSSIDEASIITINFVQPVTKNHLKLKIIPGQMSGYQQDYILSSNKRLQNQTVNFSEITLQPILLLLIKNVSFKRKFARLNRELAFQNQLLKSFSHELRTPLNCSIQMLQISRRILENRNNENEIRGYIMQALISNQLLLYQLNDILDFAAIQCGTFRYNWSYLKLSEILLEIDHLYSQACRQKDIFLKIICKEELQNYRLQNDQRRLMQIIVNLLNNSLKFTKQGGIINFKIKLIENNQVKITVKDNGIGINDEKLTEMRKIFQKSRTSNSIKSEKLLKMKQNSMICKNSKLGLNIANMILKGLTNSQDNYLSLKSHQFNGTSISFIIENLVIQEQKTTNFLTFNNQESQVFDVNNSFQKIALQQAEVDEKKKDLSFQELNFQFEENIQDYPKNNQLCFEKYQQTRQKYETKNKICQLCTQVLIVDDIPFNQIALKAMLKLFNITADSAFDGYQAIEIIKGRLHKHCRQYELIFMDIEMPGIDGFKTTTKIEEILSMHNLPMQVVMCSAYDTDENIQDAKRSGMIDFLPKPIEIKVLKRIIDQYLY